MPQTVEVGSRWTKDGETVTVTDINTNKAKPIVLFIDAKGHKLSTLLPAFVTRYALES